MYTLFYVPPHQPRVEHPKPVGVRTVIKRGAPERLDFTAPMPGAALDLGLVTLGDAVPEKGLGPQIVTQRPQTIRVRLGRALIRLGHRIAGQPLRPEGQPAL